MVDKKQLTIGGIILTLLISGIIYIAMPDLGVKIRVDNDKSTFYVQNENNRWIVAGREFNDIYDGTSLMYRSVSGISIEQWNDSNEITIKRTTPYIRGPVIVDTYKFEGDVTDVRLFPISHTIEIYNATGYFYRYEVRDLSYDGETFKLDGEQLSQAFGNNMKVEWWEGYRLGWIYKSGSMYVKSEKIDSDYVKFNVRLFDPPSYDTNLSLNGLESDRDYELETTVNISVEINDSSIICLSIDDPRYGDNYSCVTNTTHQLNLVLNDIAYNNFTDGSTIQEFEIIESNQHENFSIPFYINKFTEYETEICLQESSNVSTPCSNVSNGTTNMPSEIVDDDYSTYHNFSGTSPSESYTDVFYYPENKNITQIILQIKNGNGITNFTNIIVDSDRKIDISLEMLDFAGTGTYNLQMQKWTVNGDVILDLLSGSITNNPEYLIIYEYSIYYVYQYDNIIETVYNSYFDSMTLDLGFYRREWCVQPTANETTDCGGLNTGAYSSKTSVDNYNSSGSFYVNYTKPENASIYSKWMIKLGTNDANLQSLEKCWDGYEEKVVLAFKTEAYEDLQTAYAWAQCHNGSQWITLQYEEVAGNTIQLSTSGLSPFLIYDDDYDTYTGAYSGNWKGGFAGDILPTIAMYEESMWWSVPITTDDYLVNTSIDVFNNNITDYKLYGKLGLGVNNTNISNAITVTEFIDGESGEIVLDKNKKSIKEITVSGNLQDFLTFDWIGFTLLGSETDTEAFSYTETFKNDSNIDTTESTGSYPVYIYDDYSTGEVLNRWDGDYSSDWVEELNISTNEYAYIRSTNQGSGSCANSIVETATGNFWVKDLDLKDFNRVNFTYYMKLFTNDWDDCIGTRTASSRGKIGIRDSEDNNYNIVEEYAVYDRSYEIYTDELTIEFKDDMYIYVNGDAKWQYYNDREYYLWGYGYSSGEYLATARTEIRFYNISVAGLRGNYTGNLTWENNGTIVTKNLFNSSSDIVRAKLTTYKHNTDGGNEILYLSATNDTPTWEVVSSGNFHTFTNYGQQLRAKIVANVLDESAPYTIDYFKIEIIPSSIANLSIDVSNDDIIDQTINGTLNYSKVILLNASMISSYVDSNCLGELSCDVPISFTADSTGFLEYSDIQLVQKLNEITLNRTAILEYTDNTKTEIPINISVDSGIGLINVTNLAIFKRNDTVNITATVYGDSIESVSRLIHYKYTPFYMTYPEGIDDYYIYPWSLNAQNVIPVGQKPDVPIWNYTLNNSGQSAKFFIELNQTDNEIPDCLNITYSTYYPGDEYSMSENDSVKYLGTADNMSVWSQTDLNNCIAEDLSDYEPRFVFGVICDTCVRTEEFI